MSRFDFRLPDLGEGLTEATVLRWLVTEGQHVVVDAPLVEVETAKTTVELPSPYEGLVAAIHVAENDVVPVGEMLISLDRDMDEAAPPLLVGYGPSRQPSSSASAPETMSPKSTIDAPNTDRLLQPQAERRGVLAKPPVRKLARELGVDLASVPASGSQGEVTREDVMNAAAHNGESHHDSVTDSVTDSAQSSSSFPLTGIRKQMAHAMTRSAAEAPQATIFLSVDVTRLMSLRDQLNEKLEREGTRLSIFGLMCFLFTQAIGTSPLANSRIDMESGTLTTLPEINLGVAVAGPSGLVVPNIKSANSLSLNEFSAALAAVIDSARRGSLRPEQLIGGTITVSNVGALGVDSGVPLLNPGEAAILAIGAVRRQPWVVTDPHEHLEIRSVVELALTIDHRIMDGKDGAELLRATARLMTEPALLLLGP